MFILQGMGQVCIQSFALDKEYGGLSFVDEENSLPKIFFTQWMDLPGFQGFRKLYDCGAVILALDNEVGYCQLISVTARFDFLVF